MVYKGDRAGFFGEWIGVRVSLGSPGHQHLSDVVLCFFNAALEVRLLLLQRKQNRRFIRFNPQNHDRYLPPKEAVSQRNIKRFVKHTLQLPKLL